ncbi:hypothetical protein [Lysobacter enzymogenes]|uniref:hypothetical protein n=1 Tax=Lysobacter enzymogenes TaxID=69 RepID=UPI00226499A4|nr:hypothetical protein [Lysobacter enzymogenes]UZW61544.1 hypothetical protein BV903_004365 [Lysobacter enzymogenes]
MFFAIASYTFSFLLLAGGLLALYLGFVLVKSRGRAANASTKFAATWGEKKVEIGAGSLAALSMFISLGWVIAGISTKPTMDLSVNDDGTSKWRLLGDITRPFEFFAATSGDLAPRRVDEEVVVIPEYSRIASANPPPDLPPLPPRMLCP